MVWCTAPAVPLGIIPLGTGNDLAREDHRYLLLQSQRYLQKSRHWEKVIIHSLKVQHNLFKLERTAEVEMKFKIILSVILASSS